MTFVDSDLIEKQLFPFTLIRQVADIRIGILTIREKWQLISGQSSFAIPSNLLPSPQAIECIYNGDILSDNHSFRFLEYPWQIYGYNDSAIRDDFKLLTAGRTSARVSPTNKTIAAENIFMEAGAKAEHCLLNASTGPIYIGKNAEIMEGSIIRGPFALCEGAVVKMGARIYGATTLGPYSVTGGEIKNSVIFGYSNKAHDGYLGDSVIGEWCNLGAGTSNSNLKNNVQEIKVWNDITKQSLPAGMKCGVLMGDYCRSAINTSFNCGTVTGVCCNIFGHGLTDAYIPSFTWGANQPVRYDFEKAIRDIASWKQLKKQSLTEQEVKNLRYIFDTL